MEKNSCNDEDVFNELNKGGYAWICDATGLVLSNLSTPLSEYINTHKYFINEKVPFEITVEQAVFSWYENVYRPAYGAIMEHEGSLGSFLQENFTKVFEEVCHIHYFNFSKDASYTYEDAVLAYMKYRVILVPFWKRIKLFFTGK